MTNAKSDKEAFKQLLAENEGLFCLSHDNEQINGILCDVLCKEMQEERLALYAQNKKSITFIFAGAVEGISEYIHQYSLYKKHSGKT